jgi:hypothetical protein
MAFDISGLLQQYQAAQSGFNPGMAEWREKQDAKKKENLILKQEMELRDMQLKEARKKQELGERHDFWLELAPLVKAQTPEALQQAYKTTSEKVAQFKAEGKDPKYIAVFEKLLAASPNQPDWNQRVEFMNQLGNQFTEEAYSIGARERPPTRDLGELRSGYNPVTKRKEHFYSKDQEAAARLLPEEEKEDRDVQQFIDKETGTLITADVNDPLFDPSTVMKIPPGAKGQKQPDGSWIVVDGKDPDNRPDWADYWDKIKKENVTVNRNSNTFNPDRYEPVRKGDDLPVSIGQGLQSTDSQTGGLSLETLELGTGPVDRVAALVQNSVFGVFIEDKPQLEALNTLKIFKKDLEEALAANPNRISVNEMQRLSDLTTLGGIFQGDQGSVTQAKELMRAIQDSYNYSVKVAQDETVDPKERKQAEAAALKQQKTMIKLTQLLTPKADKPVGVRTVTRIQ